MNDTLPLDAAPSAQDGPQPSLRSLKDILDSLEQAASGETVSLGHVVEELGTRSFAPLLLVPAMILVTPLSGIPGLPTIGAAFMFLISVQKLMGRPNVWLPGWMRRRKVAGTRIRTSVDWLRKPADWIDARTHRRLPWLVTRPANVLTITMVIAICLLIPFLEILPLVTSFFAAAISLYAIGLFARDGLFALLGHIWVGVAGATIYTLITG